MTTNDLFGQDHNPDILCLQESSRVDQERFQKTEAAAHFKPGVRFGGCSIMSRFKLREEVGTVPG